MSKKMTKLDSARIQAAKAKETGGKTEKGSFQSRTQSAADRNKPAPTKK